MSIFVKPEVSAERMRTCKSCKFYKSETQSCGTLLLGDTVTYYRNKIKLCGCIMPIKTKFHMAKCPAGKWEQVALTEVQIEKLKEFMQSIENKGKLTGQQVQKLFEWKARITGRTEQTSTCSDCVRKLLKEMKEAVADKCETANGEYRAK
jgi:hypothetical protein